MQANRLSFDSNYMLGKGRLQQHAVDDFSCTTVMSLNSTLSAMTQKLDLPTVNAHAVAHIMSWCKQKEVVVCCSGLRGY